MESAFFDVPLKVSRLTVNGHLYNRGTNRWLRVHQDVGPRPVQYVVTGDINYTAWSSDTETVPWGASVIIDILVARQIPSDFGDIYLPNESVSVPNRTLVVDPAKARSIHRYTKDIPHYGVWSVDVPPINSLDGKTLTGSEVIVCHVQLQASAGRVNLWIDCALYYKEVKFFIVGGKFVE
ncbi:hypothetical protein BJV74DRAFT_173407 [Russula compacta]|nr:hypothetical protein BJV74DRAFT_173407 [Russula compacta]